VSLDFIKVISEDVDRENSSAQLEYHCDWSERLDQGATLVGGLQFATPGDPTSATYTTPQAYPFGSGLYCNHVSIAALGDYGTDADDDGLYPQTAVLTVTYGPLKILNPDGTDGLDICNISTTVSAEMLPLPSGQFQWPDGTVLSEDNDIRPSLVEPYTEMSIKVLFAATPKLLNTTTLLGQVNSDDLAINDDDTYPAGTVLLLGCDTEQIVNCQGQPCWQRSLKFGIRINDDLGWNALWNPNDQEFQTITDTDSGDPPYDSGSFDDLFTIN
jgi:hypothetical protein